MPCPDCHVLIAVWRIVKWSAHCIVKWEGHGIAVSYKNSLFSWRIYCPIAQKAAQKWGDW